MTRRGLLQALAGALFKRQKVALPTFNWIDATNFPTGPANAGRQQWQVTRVGNDLYALLVAASRSTLPLYKTSDAGVTWSLLDNTLAGVGGLNGSGLYNLYTGTDLLIRLMVSDTPTGFGSATISFAQFNPASPGWTTPDGIGGGLTTGQHAGFIIDSVSFLEYRRSDGSRIVAYSDALGKVSILKVSSGGAWTSLAEIDDSGSGRVDYLFDGKTDSPGNVHLFGVLYGNGDVCSMWHISVSTADVVSAKHIIETALEDDGSTVPTGTANPAATAAGRIDISSDGTKIAFAYCKNAVSRYSSPSFIELHVAIGDLSTPLAPTWTVETVATGVNPGCLSFGASVAVGCTFKGTNSLSVYFLDGAGGGPADLKTCDRTAAATWSAPSFVWDHTASPALNSPIAAGKGLDGFDLLNAFTNGVGILIEVFSTSTYVGYTGPALRKNNYVSSGGAMVSKGSYASA